jgi:hypothetical protein
MAGRPAGGTLPLRTVLTRFQCVTSLAWVFIAFILFTSGCRKRQPVIVLDDWWNFDFARNACQYHQDNPWCFQPTARVLEYENRLEGAFAAETACHGLRLLHFAGPRGSSEAANIMARPAGTDWQLMVDLGPDDKGPVGWGIGKVGGASVISLKAQTPRQLAGDACRIIRHTGGSIH